MLIESTYKNGYQIYSIKEDLHFDSDLTQVIELIEQNLQDGVTKIALSFTPDSHFSSISISALLQCIEIVNNNGGNLAIIHQSKKDFELLEKLSLVCLMRIYTSEDDLPES